MEYALSTAGWVVRKALSAVTDDLMEAWVASKNLGAEIDALMAELHYAQAMLNSTHGREIDNPALNELLLKLQLLAYDADDVLDELDYFRIQDELDDTYHAADEHAGGCVHSLLLHVKHTTRCITKKLKSSGLCGTICGEQEEQDNSSQPLLTNQDDQKINCNFMQKLCSITRSSARSVGNEPNKLKFDRVGVSTKLTDIVKKLKPICSKVSTILALELLGSKAFNTTTTERFTTSEELAEPRLYGRELEQKWLVDSITCGEYCANEVNVIPIVGPGGIGKTAIAQQVYHQVKSHFQVTIWLCVSLHFSASKLAQEARKKMDEDGSEKEKENDTDQERIEKRLKGKRFLVVLDDMWKCHEVEWEKLLAPFRKSGGKGVVIVTTRLPDVAEMVKTVDRPILLDRLGAQDFRNLFEACVSDKQQLWSTHPELIETGGEILEKLKGSPLAAKTVGRVLRKQLNLEHWRRVLECKEWELETNENDIMPALKISYDLLPVNLARCFSYCALFPEDHEFDSKSLIQFWIGLGFLNPHNQHIRMEDVGSSCLTDSVNYGFFRKLEKENGQEYYTMHDLLHDLAVKVSRHDCLSVRVSKMSYLQVPPSVRHISIIVDSTGVEDRVTYNMHEKNLSKFGQRMQIEKLHTLMLFGENMDSFSKTIDNLFQQARTVRTVFMFQASYVEDMLHNLSDLIHLRHLKIKGHRHLEMNLPISRLYHLMIVDLENCWGCSIPLRDLSNLIHMQRIPPDHSDIFNVGKMKLLRELRRFKVRKEENGFELKELGQLLELETLGIYDIEKVKSKEEADEVNLIQKTHLRKLILHWGGASSINDSAQDQEVGSINSLASSINVV